MKEILVETSARHIHLNEEQFHILCGPDAKLEVRAELSQPGLSLAHLERMPKLKSVRLMHVPSEYHVSLEKVAIPRVAHLSNSLDHVVNLN